MAETVWYPSVDDVIAIHESIVEEYPNTESGTRNQGGIDFALDYVKAGGFNDVPNTLHGQAFHLLRLLIANHPFVDGNKRTALNTVVVFYFLNGYRFLYDSQIIDILRRFASDEADVERQTVLQYLQSHTKEISLKDAIDEWRDDLIAYGTERLSDELSDPND